MPVYSTGLSWMRVFTTSTGQRAPWVTAAEATSESALEEEAGVVLIEVVHGGGKHLLVDAGGGLGLGKKGGALGRHGCSWCSA